jgi:hypothetical protein
MDELPTLLSNFNWLIAFGVLFGYVLVDGLYAKYTLEVVSLQPFKSATIGAGMHLLLAFGILNYTENWLYVFPLVIGSWLGTYFVVSVEKNKKQAS